MTLLANVLTVGGATLASRVLGFVRDAATAAVLGGGVAADAFFVAFRLPNLFRRLFAEGAFAAAFVPMLIEVRDREGPEAARRFSGEALFGLLAVISGLTLVAMIFAPEVVRLMAPGFSADPAKLALTATLARICFPYLACISVVALFSGVLSAERRFLAAASAPIVLNTVLIGTLVGLLLWAGRTAEGAGSLLSIAVVVAGLSQVVVLTVAVTRAGVRPRFVLPGRDGRLGRLAAKAGPGLVSGGLVEINILVSTIVASVEPGAVSWLYYADRLYQLPLGVVGIAIGQVLLPEIANVLSRDGVGRAHAVQNRSLEFALALALPAAIALWLLAFPIVEVLFHRGAFSGRDALEASRALAVFALGLPAFVAVKVLSPCFFARGDTRAPMWLGGAAVVVNIALALTLRPAFGWIAVAAATAVAGWLNAGLLFGALFRRGHWVIDGDLLRRLPRLALAAGLMGGIVAIGGGLLARLLAANAPAWQTIGALGGVVVVGISVFGGLVVWLGVVDWAGLRSGRADPSSAGACPSGRDDA